MRWESGGCVSKRLELFDPEPAYLERVSTLVDLDGIRNAGLKVVTDAMHGAGAGYLPRLISGGATEVMLEEIAKRI